MRYSHVRFCVERGVMCVSMCSASVYVCPRC